jgi:TIR domain
LISERKNGNASMTQPSKAVFLSYASKDAEAAQRLCEALRAAAIEVWFDKSELRGGDAWDHHIRRQIGECALFVPIISTHSQARTEGYFRLEWDLADQRSHMIARSKAFIIPVCLDDTPDRGAEVPESFLKVQWTRLPHGTTPTAFVERVSHLLSPEPAHPPAAAGPPAATATPSQRPILSRAASRPTQRRRRLR